MYERENFVLYKNVFPLWTVFESAGHPTDGCGDSGNFGSVSFDSFFDKTVCKRLFFSVCYIVVPVRIIFLYRIFAEYIARLCVSGLSSLVISGIAGNRAPVCGVSDCAELLYADSSGIFDAVLLPMDEDFFRNCGYGNGSVGGS